MNTLFYKTTLLLFAALLTYNQSHSQCTRTPPAARTCPIGTGTAIIADGVTNNNVHGSGAVFYYNGVGGTAKISMTNDGILDVCGSLTVTASSTFNLSSAGTIQVEAGGSLTINTDITLNNTGQIVNRGTLIVNGNIKATHVNATIWNLPGAQHLDVIGAGHYITLQSGSYLINNAAFNPITTPALNLSGGFMCMGDDTFVDVGVLTSTSTSNAVIYSGTVFPACLRVSTSGQIGGQTLAANPHINACLAPGFSYTSGNPANWGSATINNNCSSCGGILPLNIIDFSAIPKKDMVRIEWTTTDESGIDRFEIQRSSGGEAFISFGTIISKNQGTASSYAFNDYALSKGTSAYRLKILEKSGAILFSKIFTIQSESDDAAILYPIPWKKGEALFIRNPRNQKLVILFYDETGRIAAKVSTSSGQVVMPALTTMNGILHYKVMNEKNELTGSGTLIVY